MADEIKDLIKDGGAAIDATADKRSEERYQDLIKKLKDESSAKETLMKENRELKFQGEWDKLLAKYPKAQEHFEEIKAESLSGKPVEDVAVVILHKNNKLMTAEQIKSEEHADGAVGGSADTKVSPPKNQGEVMRDPNTTHEDRVAILKDLEAKGELGLKV